jgi:hypothetical protein
MGAIFNTPGTIAILQFLNHHYDPTQPNGFALARRNGEHHILRNKTSYTTSYNCARQLGLDHPTYTARWKTWLDQLDKYYQTADGDFGGHLVRTMMADALDDTKHLNCNGIEFFAVPAAKFKVIYPAPTVPNPGDPTHYTCEIVVETNTIDGTLSFTRRRKWWERIFGGR